MMVTIQVVYATRTSYPGPFREYERAVFSFLNLVGGVVGGKLQNRENKQRPVTIVHIDLAVQNRLET